MSNKTFKQTFTLTFCECAENNIGMQMIGNKIDGGFSLDDLNEAKKYFDTKGAKCDLHDLKLLLDDDIKKSVDDAYVLIIKNGVKYLDVDPTKLYKEQNELDKDTKAWMKGRVVNKKARYNLCFSDFSQDPDYENKKGTVYNFADLPMTHAIRNGLSNIINNNKIKNLQCEGNYYYDLESTYIGFHGDAERRIVVAVRLGASFPLYYRWYHKNETLGKLFKTILDHGDIYLMSDKAVGNDWKMSSKYTLRHACAMKPKLIGL